MHTMQLNLRQLWKEKELGVALNTVKVERQEKVGDSDALKQVIRYKTQSEYNLLNVLQ